MTSVMITPLAHIRMKPFVALLSLFAVSSSPLLCSQAGSWANTGLSLFWGPGTVPGAAAVWAQAEEELV